MLRRKCVDHRSDALRLFVRSLATEVSSTTSAPPSPNPVIASSSNTRPTLRTSVIVNRSPTITRTPTRFENAFFQYQSRIARALHNPFPYEFYFKQGSPLEARFNIEERRREKEAFGRVSKFMMESTEANREAAELAKEEVERRATRFTEADKKKDIHSLDRRGERNLYLVIKKSEDDKLYWTFPQGAVQTGELLHQAAERILPPQCGVYMDTWMVGRKPIGLYRSPTTAPDTPQILTFFYKMHILAGQVRPSGPLIVDFAWLTKEEIRGYVEREYWHEIKDMLSDF